MSRKSFHYSGSTKAIILAAGYATRLYPLTQNMPKPLLFVTPEKTVIDLIIDDLEACGLVDEAIIVTNSKFYAHFFKWALVRKRQCNIRLTVVDDGTCSNEDRLGAIGDIFFAIKKRKLDCNLVVIAGDNLFQRGIKSFLSFALTRHSHVSFGVFDIKKKSHACRFGVVTLRPNGKVVAFEEKPKNPKSTLVATCLYYFPKETLKFLKRYVHDRAMSNDASGNYIRWLLKVDRVSAFALKGTRWYDIGHLDSYKEVVANFNDSIF
ncbi:MAG: nucleotidyltransferase family protein [Candidatus Omnitrophota bacterium]